MYYRYSSTLREKDSAATHTTQTERLAETWQPYNSRDSTMEDKPKSKLVVIQQPRFIEYPWKFLKERCCETLSTGVLYREQRRAPRFRRNSLADLVHFDTQTTTVSSGTLGKCKVKTKWLSEIILTFSLLALVADQAAEKNYFFRSFYKKFLLRCKGKPGLRRSGRQDGLKPRKPVKKRLDLSTRITASALF